MSEGKASDAADAGNKRRKTTEGGNVDDAPLPQHPSGLFIPPGYVLRAKYAHSIPDAHEKGSPYFDAERFVERVVELASEGGDGYKTVDRKARCCNCGCFRGDEDSCFEVERDSTFQHTPTTTEDNSGGRCCDDPSCTLWCAQYHCCTMGDGATRAASVAVMGECLDANHMVTKSQGVDPYFWERDSHDESDFAAQFPFEWCMARTEEQIWQMYLANYGMTQGTLLTKTGESRAMGLVTAAADLLGDRLAMRLSQRTRLDMHNPKRLGPLFKHVERIHASMVRAEKRGVGSNAPLRDGVLLDGDAGGPTAFDEAIALLSALDDSRGCCGWTYVLGCTGDIVNDLSGLMMTALVTVIARMSAWPVQGTAAWVALFTAVVDMAGNVDPLGEDDDHLNKVMRGRLSTYVGDRTMKEDERRDER